MPVRYQRGLDPTTLPDKRGICHDTRAVLAIDHASKLQGGGGGRRSHRSRFSSFCSISSFYNIFDPIGTFLALLVRVMSLASAKPPVRLGLAPTMPAKGGAASGKHPTPLSQNGSIETRMLYNSNKK